MTQRLISNSLWLVLVLVLIVITMKVWMNDRLWWMQVIGHIVCIITCDCVVCTTTCCHYCRTRSQWTLCGVPVPSSQHLLTVLYDVPVLSLELSCLFQLIVSLYRALLSDWWLILLHASDTLLRWVREHLQCSTNDVRLCLPHTAAVAAWTWNRRNMSKVIVIEKGNHYQF